MYFMGLTINVITCNTLVISIGLCVDFSAHIAHGFISRSGTRYVVLFYIFYLSFLSKLSNKETQIRLSNFFSPYYIHPIIQGVY